MIKSLNDKNYRALIAYLRSVREEQGLTTRALGALIDEPHNVVVKIESGARRLTVHEYVQYCRALQIEPIKGLELLEQPLRRRKSRE